MKWLIVISVVFAAVLVAPSGEAEVCVDGCSSLGLGLGDFVKLGPVNSGSCTACDAGTVFSYKISKTDDCNGNVDEEGTFCTTSSTAGGQSYEVNAIGAGCSGSPQGCIRLCTCP